MEPDDIDWDRINPQSPDYCSACNYDRHTCPGCGAPVPHGTIACDDCKDL